MYRIQCSDCNSIYGIGQTGRSLISRIKEHESAWRLNKPLDSRIAKHLLEYNHCTDFFNVNYVNLLHQNCKGRVFNKLEVIEIRKHLKNRSYNVLNLSLIHI